ncbi:hypothetical protein [Draconibacterium sediminis]|uniref:hypothetical protein n=1 Tax=Draconibacterium sediminis TaxID=1544798 RepID=UPI0026F30BD5|nr:hypothetical protein [Draconibacterium sediminis]
MKRILPFLAVLVMAFTACEKEDEVTTITQGDYPVKEYNLERNPSVNPWGVGMDFIHTECKLIETDLDYLYFSPDTSNAYDIKFYTVKAYYTDANGDTQSEGCPAMLLGENVTAFKVGEGVNYFDSLTVISEEMIASLVSEPEVDYEACKIDGKYDRTLLFAAVDQCVIGRSFRSNVLVVPDGKTEQEVQPVYLVKTAERGYAKFMVKQYQADAPNEKQTVVRWQVITE